MLLEVGIAAAVLAILFYVFVIWPIDERDMHNMKD
jgi:hypothetical protein